MASNSINSLASIDRRDFARRFLRTEIEQGTVIIPPSAPTDEVSLSQPSGNSGAELPLLLAEKIRALGSAGMWGALPVLVSAAILKSVWAGDSVPEMSHPKAADDQELVSRVPSDFILSEESRQRNVLAKLNSVSEAHEIDFVLNQTDSPAAASGDKVLVNLLAASQAFKSDDLLAFALAHEKGHIANGDTSWEPAATGLLWEVMEEAYLKAERAGDKGNAAILDQGIKELEKSFHANAQLNEVEADAAAVRALAAAGYDRKPGLAFLLRTAGDGHHPPGPQRVAALRQFLQGSEYAIGEQELSEILGLANSSDFLKP